MIGKKKQLTIWNDHHRYTYNKTLNIINEDPVEPIFRNYYKVYGNEKDKDYCIRRSISTNYSDFELRNIQEVRVILFSITQILSECKKDTTLDTLKFVFKFEDVFQNLKAPNVDYVKPYFKEGDPKELFISLNEFVYHLTETKSKIDILYWIDWIIGYDEILQKNKKPIYCEERDFNKTKHLNIIWILFEIFFSFKEPVILSRIIHSLFELFTIKYTPHSNRKKKYILNYCVMLIITDNIDYNKPLIENTGVFTHLKDNIELIFSQIKKSEVIE
jgi:hypothetical protein